MASRLRTRSATTRGERLWRKQARLLRRALDAQNARLFEAARVRDLLAHAVYQAARLEPEAARAASYGRP